MANLAYGKLGAASVLLLLALVGMVGLGRSQAQSAEKKLPITFSGGHETDPQDGGRPVVLIAAALGVKTEQFREAFRDVRPARNGRPSGEDARRNKAALMKVLAPLGVSNDRLDEVSNYYRYRPQNGELWRTTPAKAYALVQDGKIKQIVVTQPGSGFSTPPKAAVEGMEQTALEVTIQFDKDLKKNGAVKSVAFAKAKKTPD